MSNQSTKPSIQTDRKSWRLKVNSEGFPSPPPLFHSTYSTRFGDSSKAEPTHPSIHQSSPLSASIKSTYRFRAEGTGNTLMPCGNWAPSRNWSRIANLPKGSRINQRIRRSWIELNWVEFGLEVRKLGHLQRIFCIQILHCIVISARSSPDAADLFQLH